MEVRESMINNLKASDSQKSAEVDKLKRDLHQHTTRVKHLSEEVALGRWERDRAVEQAESDRHATEHLQVELEEERSALKKLREESAQRKSSLAEAQSRIAQLDSKAHRFEVIENYHHIVFGKVEVALSCKVGYDYLVAQLPAELKSAPDCFHYPPRVTKCLDVLLEIEKQGRDSTWVEAVPRMRIRTTRLMKALPRGLERRARTRPDKLGRAWPRTVG